MKKNSALVKVIFVSIIVAVLGYVGLDVPRDSIEDALDEQFSSPTSDSVPVPKPSQTYEVVSVIDGDTFKVLQDGAITTVRLIGINTPETKYSDRGEECYGEEASREAVRLLEDTSVTLTTDDSQDQIDSYGRLLAYATLSDGRDVGEVLIKNGFAEEFTYNSAYQNQSRYKSAERSAQASGIGMWSCD